MSNFRVGQKVVCVDDANYAPFRWNYDAPVKGRTYTVAGRGIRYPERGPHVLLEEISNGRDGMTGYRACRFRPAAERKTDISVFTAMLSPARREERV